MSRERFAARFFPYLARDGWRWRLVSVNGRIIADSSEAYTRKADVMRAIHSVITAAVALAHTPREEPDDGVQMQGAPGVDAGQGEPDMETGDT